MKILYVTTIGITMRFFTSFVKSLIDDGHIVEIATNENDIQVPTCYREWGCKIYHIDTSRSPLNIGNFKAIKQIRNLVEEENYDIVHCHTPIAAMCTRFACIRARKKGTKVMYTAHGFHFYKGAPYKNWLLYYPMEKICAYFTDALLTMNKEDYELARKKMKAKRVYYVPGVGIDLNKFKNNQSAKELNLYRRKTKCTELAIDSDNIWLLNIGELIPRKNQETLIRAVADIDKVNLTIAGQGVLANKLNGLIEELGVGDRIKLIGYRTDISELCELCDVFAFSSYHEGLPVSVMEAMASGLPCVVSNIRGNVDLVDDNGGGLFDPYSVVDCKKAISEILKSDVYKMGKYNMEKINEYSIEVVNQIMLNIYRNVL